MSKRLEKLMFTIGLIDKTRGPAGRVMATINQINQRTQQGIRQSAVGAAGLIGAGYALQSALMPAIEMDRALGEIKSLGVAQRGLDDLTRSAIDFSTEFGESAVEFVKASYDIKSAIGGLKGNELSVFTETSAVLAKATKANINTITDYMGTMYGIFKADAMAMGNKDWVNRVAGMTAQAVNDFKLEGTKISSAFSQLGADATASGIAMSEQFAIIGTLGASMSGSMAATKYKSFLANVGKAQDALGLKFTDSEDKMLSMPLILQKIRSKFGDLKDNTSSDLIMKAFGKNGGALIKLLIPQIDALTGKITDLSKVKGADKSLQMARDQIDMFQQLSASIKGVSTTFGLILLPVLKPFIDGMTAANQQLITWARMFPRLAKVAGVVGLSILGVVIGLSAFAIIIGIAKILTVGFSVVTLALNAVMVTLYATFGVLKAIVIGFTTALAFLRSGVIAYRAALILVTVASWLFFLPLTAASLITTAFTAIVSMLKTALIALRGALIFAQAAAWLFNAAILSNPITWLVVAIVAGVAVIGLAIYGIVTHWAKVKEKINNTVDSIIKKFKAIPTYFLSLKDWFKTLDLFSFLDINILDKVINILGFADNEKTELSAALPSLNNQVTADIESGGLNTLLAKSFTENRSMGDVHIHTTQKPDGFFIHDELEALAT